MNKKGFVQLIFTPIGQIFIVIYLLVGLSLSWSVALNSYDFILECPTFIPDETPIPKDPGTT